MPPVAAFGPLRTWAEFLAKRDCRRGLERRTKISTCRFQFCQTASFSSFVCALRTGMGYLNMRRRFVAVLIAAKDIDRCR